PGPGGRGVRRRRRPRASEPGHPAEHRDVRLSRRPAGGARGACRAGRGSPADPRRGRSGAVARRTRAALPRVRRPRGRRERGSRRGRRRDRRGAPVERVTVRIPGRPYDVVIGPDVIARADELAPDLPGATRAFVVADRTVADAWFGPVCEALERRGLHAVLLTVPVGEAAKTLD